MAEIFPGFYERTNEELSMLWQEATFVLDTNMLLNVYRYREETRERLFEILEKLKERLWIPHQVMYEYLNNRSEVISQQLKVYSEISKTLKEVQERLKGLAYLKGKHRFIEIDNIIEAPVRALGESNRKLSAGQQRHRQEFENLKISDSHRERIIRLFQGKIGTPYKKNQLFDIYHQADKRFELQIPPGWKDKGKKTYDKYGDVILWFQLLDYAHANNKSILFITDDVKSDWFLPPQEGNGHPRPRPELVQEMYGEADILLHVYPGPEFFDQATKFLNLKSEPSIIEDVKEVSEGNAVEEEVVRPYTESDLIMYFMHELELDHPNAILLREARYSGNLGSSDPRFPEYRIDIMKDELGVKTGVEVMYFKRMHHALRDIEGVLERLKLAVQFDKIQIFIVVENEISAADMEVLLKKNVVLPSHISIVIFYIGLTGGIVRQGMIP
jgi:predicted nucleic acid-binding protein